MKNPEQMHVFFQIVEEEGLYGNSGNLRFYLDNLFSGITFAGKSMLDVGAGSGLFSLYAACMGARPVVALEPELAGSPKETSSKLARISARWNLEQITLERVSIQEYSPEGRAFDIILLRNAINHLDEEACANLQDCRHSRYAYSLIFRKLGEVARPGCRLIITDCSRYNFFALMGLPNPFAPRIGWHKHQSPEFWARMLRDHGFGDPLIRWTTFNSLRGFGKRFLANKVAAYFLRSHFTLVMTKA